MPHQKMLSDAQIRQRAAASAKGVVARRKAALARLEREVAALRAALAPPGSTIIDHTPTARA